MEINFHEETYENVPVKMLKCTLFKNKYRNPSFEQLQTSLTNDITALTLKSVGKKCW